MTFKTMKSVSFQRLCDKRVQQALAEHTNTDSWLQLMYRTTADAAAIVYEQPLAPSDNFAHKNNFSQHHPRQAAQFSDTLTPDSSPAQQFVRSCIS